VSKHPEPILFITSTRIGDAVLSTGILHYLLQQRPGAPVTIACGPAAAGLFTHVPNLQRVIVIHKKTYGRHWLHLWAKTISQRYGVIVDLRRSALAYFLRAHRRFIAGPGDPEQHKVLQLGAVLDLNPPPAPYIWLSEAEHSFVRARIPVLGKKPLLVFGPTANWGGKTWAAQNFTDLIHRITASTGIAPDAAIALVGGPQEQAQAAPIAEAMANYPHFYNLVGELNVLQSAALCQAATMFIGHDSGLMHIAAAVGGNVLGLFGPSPETNYAPWATGLGQTAFVRTRQSYQELVYAPDFDHRSSKSLMDGLSVDMAYAAVEKLWDRIQWRAVA